MARPICASKSPAVLQLRQPIHEKQHKISLKMLMYMLKVTLKLKLKRVFYSHAFLF